VCVRETEREARTKREVEGLRVSLTAAERARIVDRDRARENKRARNRERGVCM